MEQSRLDDVLYVPELSYLISVSKATEKGVTITFDEAKCSIFDKKMKLISEGAKLGSLYHLKCCQTLCQKIQYTTAINEGKQTNNLWHRRFRHLSLSSLQTLEKLMVLTLIVQRRQIFVNHVPKENNIVLNFLVVANEDPKNH